MEPKEWWEVAVSWDSLRKQHTFDTLADANVYAERRVARFQAARANSPTYVPLVVKWEEDTPFCVRRALLGPELLGTPVWDYTVSVHHCKRGEDGRVVRFTRAGEPASV